MFITYNNWKKRQIHIYFIELVNTNNIIVNKLKIIKTNFSLKKIILFKRLHWKSRFHFKIIESKFQKSLNCFIPLRNYISIDTCTLISGNSLVNEGILFLNFLWKWDGVVFSTSIIKKIQYLRFVCTFLNICDNYE